jgi:hypothetical protein
MLVTLALVDPSLSGQARVQRSSADALLSMKQLYGLTMWTSAYPETQASYVTDLRPLLQTISDEFPATSERIRAKYPSNKSLNTFAVDFTLPLSSDPKSDLSLDGSITATLYSTLAEAENQLLLGLAKLPAVFVRDSFGHTPIGELVFSYDWRPSSVTECLLRKNVVVYIRIDSPAYHDSQGKVRFVPDSGIASRADTLAQQLDSAILALQ